MTAVPEWLVLVAADLPPRWVQSPDLRVRVLESKVSVTS